MANLSNINNKFLVTTGGNVGIGVTGPVVKLELQDTTHTTMKIRSGNNDNILFLQAIQGQDGRIGTETNNDLGFYTNGTDRLTISNTGNATFAGNVGIGVTPEAWTVFKTSQIGQASAFVGRISLNQTDVATNFYYDGSEKRITTGYAQRYTQTSDGNHQFWTAGTDSADSAITFSKKFEILNNGNATFAGGINAQDMRLQSSGTTYLNIGNGSTGSTSTDGASIGYFTGQTSLQIVQRENDAMVFSTNSNERMRITSAGKVGIGTTAPAAKLHVENTNAAIVYVKSTINNQNASIWFNSNSGGTQADRWEIGTNISAGTDLEFFDRLNSVSRMVIQNDGNVGIGTISPEAKLDISNVAGATYALEISTPERNRALFYYNSASASDAGYLGIKRGSVDALNHRFATTGNSAVCIEEGNFGIGTDSPSEKLTLQLNTQNQAFSGKNGTDYLWFLRNEAGAGARQSGRFQLMDTDVTTVNIESASNRNTYFNAGNIGIGTTSPTKQLHLLRTTGDVRGIMVETTVATSYAEVQVKAASEFRIGTGGSGTTPNGQFYIYDATAGAHRFDIDANGNVIIGNVTERGKLTINSSATSGNSNALGIYAASDGGTHTFAQFLLYGTSTVVGGITSNGTTTSYNETSDYRLKEDLQDFAGLDMVSKIPVYDFKWKADESRSYGVMAHELQEVLPQAVVGEKDAEEMQGVDYSKIVPLLVKSIQELKAEIDELKK